MNASRTIALLFHSILLLVTGGLLVYCTIRYIENHSSTSTSYKNYHKTARDIYPSIALCFNGLAIYDSDKMKQMYGINDPLEYQKYLSGEKFNETMLDVDFDEVTDHLKEYFIGLDVSFDILGNHPAFQWINLKNKSNEKNSSEIETGPSDLFPFSISQRTSLEKCFTFDFLPKKLKMINGKIIRRFMVYLNVAKLTKIDLSVLMSYPGQMSRAIPVAMSYKQDRNILSGNFDLKEVAIGVTEVIRRRESSKESCNPESERWDEMLFQKIADSLSCRPSHWTNVDYSNLCNDSKAMKRANFMEKVFIDPDDQEEMTAPCDELIDVDSKISDYPRGTLADTYTDLKANFEVDHNSSLLVINFERAVYREISNFRSYNLEGLVGNGGGYVGLFLGFAAWQIPDLANFVYNYLAEKNLSLK